MFIQIKNLSKKFNNNLAVNNISFDIKKNQTVGLLGPNGCGKTTSIGMMLGLIKPSEGEIIIDNKNINKEKRDGILSKINFASPYIELPFLLKLNTFLFLLYFFPKTINAALSSRFLQLSFIGIPGE